MSTEETAIVRQAPPVIIPRTLDEVIILAEKLSKSSLLPEALRNKVPEVMMQIMAGQELGFAPMAALRSFSIITGKPVMSADAMVAIVLGSGKCEYFRRVSESATEVTYVTKRIGQPEQKCQWTMEMAKVAALHQKDNWRTYPRAMLASRAKSELARDVYPDVLAGVYTSEELEPSRPIVPPTDAIDAEFTEAPTTPTPTAIVDAPEVLAIDTMETVEALKSHGSVIKALNLTGPAALRANERYTSRMKWLKSRPTSGAGASGSAAVTSNGSAAPSSASTGSDA